MGSQKFPLISGTPRARRVASTRGDRRGSAELLPAPCPTVEDGVLFETLGRLVGGEVAQGVGKQCALVHDVIRDHNTMVRRRVNIRVEASKSADAGHDRQAHDRRTPLARLRSG